VRRADGKHLDFALHVNSSLDEKGLAAIYNPTDHAITEEIVLPLYFTGLKRTASAKGPDGKVSKVKIDEAGKVRLTVTVPPMDMTWLVFSAS
jgi:hypothetical protein